MNGIDDTDEALVRRLRAGDDDAGTILFQRLFPILRSSLRQKLGPALRPKVGASDLIQAAYAAVVCRLDEFRDRGPGSFRRWISGILDHKLIDEIRRHQGRGKRERARELGLAALSEHSLPRAKGESPSGAAIAGEARHRIRAAVARLTPDHRAVVRLLHERGMPMDEAAAEMGRTPAAVRMLYVRALARLSTLLAEEDAP